MNRLILTTFRIVSIACIIIAATARADDTSPALLNRDALIAAAAGITTGAFPNADAVLVDDYVQTRYNADGTYESLNDSCMKILTEKGKRGHRTISQYYDLAYGTAMVLQAEIIKPDGTVVPVNVAEQGRHMVDRSQMSANIYNPNSKILTVSIPGLEIGDMLRYVSRRVVSKARMPDTFSDYNVLEYTAPIKHATIEIYGPKELLLAHTELKDIVEGTVTSSVDEQDGQNRYRWEVSDVPRMFAEPKMPALHTVVQRLLVSTIPDWQTVSKWYFELCEPRLEADTPEMKETVNELIKDCKTKQEKIEAIFYYVSQKIRYMGITTEDTAPGYEPHDVSITFNNKYGVCRDKAALLATMLRLGGFKGYPVLIYAGPKKDPEVPQPFFNHAITCVENDDGTYILMDPTDENTKELLPAYLCDKSYIVAKPEGDILRTSPIVPAEENMMTIETTGELDSKGTLTAESVLRFKGINDNAYRGAFSTMKEERRKRFFEGLVKRVAPGAELNELEIKPDDMMDVSTSLTVRLVYSAKDVPITNGDIVMLPPLWLGTSVSVVNFVLGETGLDIRKYPYRTDIACGVAEQFTLKLGEAVDEVISLPKYSPVDTKTIGWSQSMNYADMTLAGNSDFRIKAVEFSTNDYLVLKDTLKTIEYDRRKQPIFQAPLIFEEDAAPEQETVYPDADIVVLSQDITHRVKNATEVETTVDVKTKILTYAGKKANAELKINYNPVWDDVSIEKAVVTTVDGQKKELSEEELNLMDAAWVASAPRYPAGKTLVASLPGVDIGSIVEYRIVYTHKNRPFLSFAQGFWGSEPVEKRTIRMEIPEDVTLRMQDAPGGAMAMTKKETDGLVTYTWSAVCTNVVKPEPSLPPWWCYTPGVIMSVGDWQAYAGQVRETLTAAAAQQKETATQARKLTEGITGAREKIIAIRDFMAKNIRAAGPGLTGLPLSAVTPADKTLADAYGNNSDRAVVLYCMLEAAGLKPEFVLSSGQPIITRLVNPMIDCPQRSVFGSVLVRVKLDGAYVYLNDTDQYAELGTTPHDKRPSLLLSSGKIEPVAVAADKESRSETTYDITLAEDGSAEITYTRLIYGTGFSAFHRQYAEMPPEERRRHYLELVASLSQSAKAKGDLVTDYDSYPGRITFTATVDRYAVQDGDNFYFTLPAGMGNVLSLSQDERENPLFWGGETRATVISRITLPEAYTTVQLAPPDIQWNAPEQAGTITYSTVRDPEQKNTLTVKQEIDLTSAIIPARYYPVLLETNRKLSHPAARTILAGKE
jgi:transglutaminase-like putative cysteine protease